MDLMPAMCNPDYDSMPQLGVHLIRPKTVGMGYDICDYYMVGDHSELAKLSPVREDEKGFWMNDVPDKMMGRTDKKDYVSGLQSKKMQTVSMDVISLTLEVTQQSIWCLRSLQK